MERVVGARMTAHATNAKAQWPFGQSKSERWND